jgi:hypothetical protein
MRQRSTRILQCVGIAILAGVVADVIAVAIEIGPLPVPLDPEGHTVSRTEIPWCLGPWFP